MKDQNSPRTLEEAQAETEFLYQRYYKSVFAYFMKKFGFNESDARELAQETFLRAFRSPSRYRVEDARSWLLTIAKRIALNEIRGRHADKRRAEEISLDMVSPTYELPDSSLSPEENALMQDSLRLLQKALGELPPRMQMCFRLYLSGWSITQICNMLKLTPGTVKVQLHRARHILSAELKSLRFPAEQ